MILWLLFSFIKPAFSQNNQLNFEHFTVERGLSQSSVLSIAQDSVGFLWFGTKDGLNRFDAQTFEVYKHKENDSSSLSSSTNINALLTDSKGNLWIGTQNGLNRFVPSSNSFVRYQHQAKNKNSLSNNVIRCIYEDRKGNIWIGTDSGLNKLLTNKIFAHYSIKANNKGIAHPTVKAIFQDVDNDIWLATQSGLTRMKEVNGTYKFHNYYHDNNNSNSLAANDINTITEDLNHSLWIGTHFNGLDLFDKNAQTFTHFKESTTSQNGLSSNVIRKIKVDKNGLLWIATLNGITVLDPVKRTFNLQQHDPEKENSLNQNSVYDILQDKAGSIWVGTYYGGVNVYHANAEIFKTYKHFSYKNSLSSNIISAIVEDNKGDLWIGTEAEGLNYYNRKTNVFTNFKAKATKGNSLSSNLIKALSIDKNNNIWIAAYEAGLDFYNTKTGEFKNYKLDKNKPNSLEANRITSLLCDDRNQLWIGTKGNGVYLHQAQSADFESVLAAESKYHLKAKYINYITADHQQNLWVSTAEGLFYLPKNKYSFRKLILENQDFFFNNISFIYQDTRNTIWLGSYNDGLAAYNVLKKTVKIFNTSNGIPSATITAITEDNEGFLWVSTTKGLAKLENGKFKVFTRKDGLPGNVFNFHSVLKDRAGNIFFGGYNGMVSFNPVQMKENNIAPKLTFTHLRLFNKEVHIGDNTNLLDQSLAATNNLSFAYDQNIFSIDFADLNYIKSSKNRYAYKINGLEEGWTEIDKPSVSFSNIPAGNYRLLVKGSNNDGVWSDKILEIAIKIRPPFWLTWWAYLIYVLLLLSIVFIIARYFLIKALLKKEHDVHQMKLDFFTNVSHEIRTPLTLIAGPLEDMLSETQESRKLHRQLLGVNKNVKRLLRLVNELMDFRKIESGKMKLKVSEADMVAFAKEIFLSFQQMAVQQNVNYTFNSQKEILPVFFDKNQLEKVIYNLLSNAFKFVAPAGDIILDVSEDDEQVYISVRDNGVGIPKEAQKKIFTDFYQANNQNERNVGTGIGLALAKRIALLHHGDLVLDDKSIDTKFCLSFKKGKNHFESDEIDHYPQIDDEVFHVETITDTSASIYIQTQNLDQKNKEKTTLLIVDDNPDIRQFMIKTFSADFHVLEAVNGEEALGLAIQHIPDILISDVMMPVMDGFELCRMIKTDERTSHIPVILLTARSGDIFELDGLKTGADIYLTKPFSVQKLHLTVHNILALQENMRRKFSQHLSLEPNNVIIESNDEEFLQKVLHHLEDNINNPEFNVNQFAADIGMSTPIFYKKIKALTGLTVNNFMKSFRLKRAAQLLKQNAGNVNEIAYMVGFSDPKYFSKEFRKQFGQAPSSYR